MPSLKQYRRAGVVLAILAASGALSALTSPGGAWAANSETSMTGDTVFARIGDSVFVAFFVSGDSTETKVFRGGATYKACGMRTLSARFYHDPKFKSLVSAQTVTILVPCDTTKMPPVFVGDTTKMPPPVRDTTKRPP